MKSLRVGVGLLGKEVAGELGVSAETVSRWERGVSGISKVVEEGFLRLIQDVERVKVLREGRRGRRVKARGDSFLGGSVEFR
jgi:transcriptional regulator with XRE-family HTH domain